MLDKGALNTTKENIIKEPHPFGSQHVVLTSATVKVGSKFFFLLSNNACP